MTETQMMIHQAITYATVAHMGQTRKGTLIPYIVHPFEVAQILTAAGADAEVICAGLLHDTVEDTDASLEDIRTLFGDKVASLVDGASEDKSKTWQERKQHTIDYLAKEADLDELLLACADKLANMRAMAHDYAAIGDQLWERFNAGRNQLSWYYGSLTEVLEPLHEYEMYWELVNLYQEVFVKYYRRLDTDELIQDNGIELHTLSRDYPQWIPTKNLDPNDLSSSSLYDEMSKQASNALEEQWQAEYRSNHPEIQ